MSDTPPVEPARQDEDEVLVPVRLGGVVGFGRADGTFAVPPRFDDLAPLSSGLAAARVGEAWGYVDAAGELVIAATFDFATAFCGDRAVVHAGGRALIIDRTGATVASPAVNELRALSEGLAPARQDDPDAEPGDGPEPGASRGRWGYADASGAIVIAPRFEDAWGFSDGVGRVLTAAGYAFLGRDGQPLGATTYDAALDFTEGLAAVEVNGRWGFIDRAASLAIGARFTGASSFHGGLAAVRTERGWGFVDPASRLVVPPGFERLGDLHDGRAPALAKSPRALWGYVDAQGAPAVPDRFLRAGPFHGGLAEVAGLEGRGYIDRDGGWVFGPEPLA